jgi:hypothetical protein
MTSTKPDWTPILVAATLLVVVPAGAILLGKWVGIHPPPAASVAGVIAVSLAFLLVLLAVVSTAFPRSGAGSREALGMPPGSVRALLAFLILFAFVALAIDLMGMLGPKNRAAAIQQIFGAMGTLVTAVAAFYFGSKSVETGAKALATVSGVTPPPTPPEATTGDSADGATLKGTIHPHGLAARYYFAYASTASETQPAKYDKQTEVAILDAATAATEVTATPSTAVTQGAWYRLIAFNEAGLSEAAPKRVPVPAAPPAQT